MVLRRLLVVFVVLGALLFLGAFAFYRGLTAPVAVSTNAPVAATLTIPTAVAAATTAEVQRPAARPAAREAPAPLPQLYRIDSSRSQVTYRVKETFFDERGRTTAVGSTNAIAGDTLVNRADPPASQVGEIVVDVGQLRTDDPQRDNAVRRGLLESVRFPLARFRNARISGLSGELREGLPFTFTLQGDLTVRNVTRPVTWSVDANLAGDTLAGRATTQVLMTDFGIRVPNLRILRAEDEVALELEFVAVAVDAATSTAPSTTLQSGASTPDPVVSATTKPVTRSCTPTNGYSGPNYKPGAPIRSSLGKGFVLRGTVVSSPRCVPVPGAKVEFWMAGPDGRYSDDYRAAVIADEQGRFRLESIMPPAYGGGVPHIHVKVTAKGYRDDGTEYLLRPDQKEGVLDLVLAPLRSG